jgi:phenylpyruvate tautomerase PptA (4-oxalocrotonate tautomerase family)
MPFINIKTYDNNMTLDLDFVAQELSQKTGLEINRIMMIKDIIDDDKFFKGSEDKKPLVTINISKRNGKELIQKIIKSIAEILGEIYRIPSKDIIILCKVIDEGYTFINGDFV